MPLQAQCPSCRTTYTLVDAQAGKTVRCVQCQGIFTVPTRLEEVVASATPRTRARDEWYDDRRSGGTSRDAEKEPSNKIWIILFSILGLAFLGLMITGLILVFTPQTDTPLPGVVLVAPFNQAGTLQWNSPRYGPRGTIHHVYQVQLTAGTTYQFDMTSPTMDSYLVIEDQMGNSIAEDDDGGGALNAMITYRPPFDGAYRIIVTTCDQEGLGGEYMLSGRTIP